MGLGDFVEGIGDAAKNVGKAGGWLANPTHWDDVARGVGNAAEFVAENPGKVWDTGFEVGRAMLKDQLDPVNLAINAGLIGLTVATAGGAAPALAAKLGMSARTAKVGIEAVQGARAVQEGVALGRGAKFVQEAKSVVQGVRSAKGLEKLDLALEAPTQIARAGREAVGMQRLGMVARGRETLATKAFPSVAEGSASGFSGAAQRAGYRTLAGGETRAITGARSAGSDWAWRYNKGRTALDTPGNVQEGAKEVQRGVEIAADPGAAAMNYATEKANQQFLQPAQMPNAGFTPSDPGEATSVANFDWSGVSGSGSFAGRSSNYGPTPAYRGGRGFQSQGAVDWGAVVPEQEQEEAWA